MEGVFSSRITALGVVCSSIPDLESVSGRLPREVRRPSQNVATFTLAEPIAAQHQAYADFQRLRLASQPRWRFISSRKGSTVSSRISQPASEGSMYPHS